MGCSVPQQCPASPPLLPLPPQPHAGCSELGRFVPSSAVLKIRAGGSCSHKAAALPDALLTPEHPHHRASSAHPLGKSPGIQAVTGRPPRPPRAAQGNRGLLRGRHRENSGGDEARGGLATPRGAPATEPLPPRTRDPGAPSGSGREPAAAPPPKAPTPLQGLPPPTPAPPGRPQLLSAPPVAAPPRSRCPRSPPAAPRCSSRATGGCSEPPAPPPRAPPPEGRQGGEPHGPLRTGPPHPGEPERETQPGAGHNTGGTGG